VFRCLLAEGSGRLAEEGTAGRIAKGAAPIGGSRRQANQLAAAVLGITYLMRMAAVRPRTWAGCGGSVRWAG
jgi:hypothetical protein